MVENNSSCFQNLGSAVVASLDALGNIASLSKSSQETTSEAITSSVGIDDFFVLERNGFVLGDLTILVHDHGLVSVSNDNNTVTLGVDLIHLTDLGGDLLQVLLFSCKNSIVSFSLFSW